MHICSPYIEDRIFHLLDGTRTPRDVAAVLGMPYEDAMPLIAKVINERGTAGSAAIEEGIRRLEAIRV
jgi:hypothetical protein